MIKTFTFDVSISATLAVGDIWPDRDAPENPTVQDVLDVVAKCGGRERVIKDWELDRNARLIVTDDDTGERGVAK